MAATLGPDEVFRTLFEYCGAKPGAVVDHPWGEVVFKVKKKIFAYIGRPGESSGVTVKPAPEELDALLARPNVQLAHYIGRFGWVNVSIHDQASMKLALRLVDETYEQIAHGKKGGARKAASPSAAGETPPPAAKKSASKEAPAKKEGAAKKEAAAKAGGAKKPAGGKKPAAGSA
ncbi:MAG TPA: MmcQ/YjbR family DNA-binding protein [Longimicrobium sp.]